MLRKQIQKLALIVFVAFFFTSCNEYQKVLKNNDTKEMYEYAMRYYEEEDYPRAKHLFELIAPKYVGKPQGERLSFFLQMPNSKRDLIICRLINSSDLLSHIRLLTKENELPFMRLRVII